MCRDVDAGIFAAFEAGVIAQASWMAPGPSAAAAAAHARGIGLACGLHLTFASEWDLCRWPSVSGDPALAAEDGNLPLHPSRLEDVDPAILLREARLQMAAGFEMLGRVSHFDCHVAPLAPAILGRLADEFALRSRDPLPGRPDRTLPITRRLNLTEIPAADKVECLLTFARAATDGLSVVITHPAVDGQDLRSLCSEDMPGRYPWSREWRLSDLDALTSPRVRNELTEIAMSSF
jgi:predicted glycoside hydrolase/deacetylase ChbG (UPF0249 family)